jgi:hypothetical protein
MTRFIVTDMNMHMPQEHDELPGETILFKRGPSPSKAPASRVPAMRWRRLTEEIVHDAVGHQIRFKSRRITRFSTIVRATASGKSIAITGDGDLGNHLNLKRKIEVLM